jgi:hypothetical protein
MSFQPTMKHLTILLALGLSGATAAACGGSAAPAEAPVEAATAPEEAESQEAAPEEEVAEEGPAKFDDMSAPEKMKHMKEVVAPAMGKVFGKDDFSCTTCHGPGAKQGNFSMPTDALPPLNKAEMDAHPEATKFMMEKVVPEMAKLLGEDPYNPETHEGFGCYDCHTKKE